MVSALDCRSRGPGSSPGRVIVLCSWSTHFTDTVPLSTREYKWVTANCQGNLTKCWEVTCDGLASHPGGVAILLVDLCDGNRDKLSNGPLSRLVRLTLPIDILHTDFALSLVVRFRVSQTKEGRSACGLNECCFLKVQNGHCISLSVTFTASSKV